MKFYDKRDYFDFDIVRFSFLDGVYISQLICLLDCPVMLMTFILVIKI